MSLTESPPSMSSGGDMDARFTADVSQKMTVPHHIRFTPNGGPQDTYQRPSGASLHDTSGRYTHTMRVPDRILVAGGEEHVGGRMEPREIALDLQLQQPFGKQEAPLKLHTPPSTLTLQETPFPSLENDAAQDNTPHRKPSESKPQHGGSDSAAAPDWFRHMGLPTSEGQAVMTPVQELSLIKRQVSKLGARLYTLEQEMEFRNTRDYWLAVALALYLGIKVVMKLKG